MPATDKAFGEAYNYDAHGLRMVPMVRIVCA
jgi:hypothetical protein